MRTQRNFRPALDAALEDRVALSHTISPFAPQAIRTVMPGAVLTPVSTAAHAPTTVFGPTLRNTGPAGFTGITSAVTPTASAVATTLANQFRTTSLAGFNSSLMNLGSSLNTASLMNLGSSPTNFVNNAINGPLAAGFGSTNLASLGVTNGTGLLPTTSTLNTAGMLGSLSGLNGFSMGTTIPFSSFTTNPFGAVSTFPFTTGSTTPASLLGLNFGSGGTSGLFGTTGMTGLSNGLLGSGSLFGAGNVATATGSFGSISLPPGGFSTFIP